MARGRDVARAADILAQDGVVGYPTDTLYGLGARLDRPKALARVFDIKRRPRGEPLTVAVATVDEVEDVARVTPLARRLFELLPGPLTLVLERTAKVPALVTAGGSTVGVRVPAEDTALALLARSGPITATSANRHGQPPARDATAAEGALGDRVDYYLAGSSRPLGVASTLVDCRGASPIILREGAIGAAEIDDRASD